jgi:hypothetical protein
VDERGARGPLGWAGGGWSVPPDNELAGEVAAVGETRAPGAAAGGSGSNWALDGEGDTAVLWVSSNGRRGGRLVVLADEQRWWQRAEAGGVWHGGKRGEMGKWLSAMHVFLWV